MNFLITPEETSVNVPKFTENSLVIRNNYYVVTNGEVFNYYSIKILEGTKESPLLRFEKSPPVLLEGMVIVGKKVYQVTLADLYRRVIRKSREIKIEASDATNTTATSLSTIVASATDNNPIPNFHESGVSESFDLEITQAANIAWQEEVGSLLSSISEEEDDWEVTDAP